MRLAVGKRSEALYRTDLAGAEILRHHAKVAAELLFKTLQLGDDNAVVSGAAGPQLP